jgi:hypothetical protein
MAMATAVIIMNPNRPWCDDYFALFFVVSLAVA